MIKLYLAIIALLFTNLSQGWTQICELSTENRQYEEKLREVVKISLEIPMDEVKEGFNDFIKHKFDVDLKGYGFLTRKDEVYTELSTLPQLSADPVKLIGIFDEQGGITGLHLLLQKEDGDFVTEVADAQTIKNLNETGRDFLNYFVPSYYNKILEKANEDYEEAVDDVVKEEENLEKNQEDLVKLKQEIIELENEIEENRSQLIDLRSMAEKKKAQVRAEQEKLERVNRSLSNLQ